VVRVGEHLRELQEDLKAPRFRVRDDQLVLV
jgi:hypothetical protein